MVSELGNQSVYHFHLFVYEKHAWNIIQLLLVFVPTKLLFVVCKYYTYIH